MQYIGLSLNTPPSSTCTCSRWGHIQRYKQSFIVMNMWVFHGFVTPLFNLYQLKLCGYFQIFDGFEPKQFALLTSVGGIFNMIVIFGIVPVVSGYLKWHETSCLTLINALNSAAYFVATLPRTIWPGMYLVAILGASSFSEYSQARYGWVWKWQHKDSHNFPLLICAEGHYSVAVLDPTRWARYSVQWLSLQQLCL